MKDWLITVLLGAVAIPIIAGATAGFYATAVELSLWTLAGIGWVIAARRWATRPWAVVAAAGPVSGVLAGAMQAALLGPLVANHPAWADFEVTGATRFEAFYTALPIGIVWGLLFAGITWVVGAIAARRAPPAMAQ